MNDFKKAEKEFFSKRCEKILINAKRNKSSEKIFKLLSDRLTGEERELLFKYAEEYAFENAEVEEILYSGGFFDGIIFAAEKSQCF